MKARTLATVTIGALGATTFLSASPAQAVEPAQLHEGASVAGLLGFGVNTYGFDFAARGGYTLANHVYLGGTFMLNTGWGGYYGNSVGFTTGFEGGYEFAAGPVVVRPYGGIGFANETYNGYGYYGNGGVAPNPVLCAQGFPQYCGNGYAGASYTTSSVALWFGGTAIYDFKGGPWFVCGDGRIGDAPAFITNQVIFAFTAGGGYEF